MPRPSPALTCLLAAIVAACGGLAASTPQPAASVGPSAGPTLRELAASPDPLPAGTYTRSGFEPPITFELDGSWSGVQLFDGFFDVQQDVGSPDVIAVQFGLPRAVNGADAASIAATTAEAAAAAVAENQSLEVLGQNPAQVGGLSGITIEVENATNAHAVIMSVPPGPLGIDPGRRLWIASWTRRTGCWPSWSAARWRDGTRPWPRRSRCWNRSASAHERRSPTSVTSYGSDERITFPPKRIRMHPNAKILHDAMETVNTGNPEAAMNLLADDVEWHEIGRSEPTRGKEAVIQRFTESFGDAEVEAKEHTTIADDEHAIQLMNVTARRGDKSLNYRTAEIFHMRDGKITARWAFSDDTQAIIDFFA